MSLNITEMLVVVEGMACFIPSRNKELKALERQKRQIRQWREGNVVDLRLEVL